MSEERRVSENTKLQGIMNALLLPAAGQPAGGTRRIKDSVAGVRQALPATPVMPSSVTRIALGQPEMVAAAPAAKPAGRLVLGPAAEPVENSAVAVAPAASRAKLFLAPVADEAAEPVQPAARTLSFAIEPVEASTVATLPARKSQGIEPGEYAAAISGIMAAVLELTILEPVADLFVSFEDAPGEAIRKTSQRGRAGKLPKQARTTRRAQQSMAMALRDARRLSQRIAEARAEDATRKDIDALWAEMIQTRRRCQSPSYAKALREALPVVLPNVLSPDFEAVSSGFAADEKSNTVLAVLEETAGIQATSEADMGLAEDVPAEPLAPEPAAAALPEKPRKGFFRRLFAA